MTRPTSDDIRKTFLGFFEAKGHRVVASAPLVLADDPTLLFVNAGMVQFKDVFAGRKDIGARRATSCQKCLRVSGKHNDLENVGRTARHHTFFEMLGNFSFGDYFKREAIHYAWELLTSPAYYGLPVEQLWVTVHPDDDEARRIWRDEIGVPAERIVDDPDNFWSMGDTGPCGPCSEIHIDQGPALSGGVEVPFGEGGDRYLELWNLVFMQFERHADGTLTPLPRPSIDTGMGLERIAAVLQGVHSNYDTDLFRPLIERVEELSGRRYQGRYAPDGGMDPAIEEDVAFRVIADHARATAFLVADGVYPENEGRGYVLRRIMRRAIRFGRTLGITRPFLHEVCARVVDRMGETYSELRQARDVIERVVVEEEKRFGRTLDAGLRLLDAAIERARTVGARELPGDVVFTLYDTHGFPVDLTRLIAAEHGLGVNEAGFEQHMEAQRARGRASWRGAGQPGEEATYEELARGGLRSEFTGYHTLEDSSRIRAVLRDGRLVSEAKEGDEVEVVVDRTPFYAESGGQVGDRGVIETPGGARIAVVDVQRPADGLVVHRGKVVAGALREGDEAVLRVDPAHREPTRRHHSATHLMHWALRHVLGDHVRQRGSLVAPDRLRFDFSHFSGLTPDEVREVERLVNERVVLDAPVETVEMAYDEAIARGALAFFGDKYGDRVRVVTMAESVELCGGTHVAATGQVGLFKLVSEGSISSGVRRVEAVSGLAALAWMHEQERGIERMAALLRVGPAELEKRLGKLVEQSRALREENEILRARLARAAVANMVRQARDVGGIRALALRVDGEEARDLRKLADTLLDELGSGAVLLAVPQGGRIRLLVGVTPDLEGRLHAGDVVRELAPIVGGRGGGRARMAQAGGNQPEHMDKLFEHFYGIVRSVGEAN